MCLSPFNSRLYRVNLRSGLNWTNFCIVLSFMHVHTYKRLWSHCSLQRRCKEPKSPGSQRCTWTPHLGWRPGPPLHLCVACSWLYVIIYTLHSETRDLRHIGSFAMNLAGAFSFFGYILVFSQQFGTGHVKDSDNTRAEATGEDWVAGMESHTARAVHRHKVIQLFRGDNTKQHYCWWGI